VGESPRHEGPRLDRAAWHHLVVRHGRAVWLSIVALGVAPDLARELAQATWLRLFEQVERGAIPEVRMPGLALAQARFLALDELRRQRAGLQRLADVAELDAVPDPADAEAELIVRERFDRALAALRGCSPMEQRIFHLVYDDFERPHAAIAAEVDLSTQRVRQILCAVRARLRAALETE